MDNGHTRLKGGEVFARKILLAEVVDACGTIAEELLPGGGIADGEVDEVESRFAGVDNAPAEAVIRLVWLRGDRLCGYRFVAVVCRCDRKSHSNSAGRGDGFG